MCSLASLAEFPTQTQPYDLVKRLFVTQSYNENGLYILNMCKNGEWQQVLLDDYFPCTPGGGPLFSRAHGKELWVLLIEKAYAKLNGCYYALRGGFCYEGMMDLTGFPSTQIRFDDDDIQQLIQQNQLFKILAQYDDQGFMLSAGTPGEDKFTEKGGQKEEGGLVPGHAYSIIQVKEAYGNRLLNIRNPWGNFEWNGDWGDKSSLWSQKMIDALNPTFDTKDGTFWMSYEDFLKNFVSVNVCKVKNWQEIRIKGKFIRENDQVKSHWNYRLNILQRSEIVITLHQEDERTSGVKELRSNLDIGFIILQQVGQSEWRFVKFQEIQKERQNLLEITLDQGYYVVVPVTTGCLLQRYYQKGKDCSLLTAQGLMTEEFRSTCVDIFRKFDLLMNWELSFEEFQVLYTHIGLTLTQQEFEEITSRFGSSQKGLSLQGFLMWFRETIINRGEAVARDMLGKFGYDTDLFSLNSRLFIISFHCVQSIDVTCSANTFEFENDAWMLTLQNDPNKQEMQGVRQKGLAVSYLVGKKWGTYVYGLENLGEKELEVTLNFEKSKNMLFNNLQPIIKKRVKPKKFQYLGGILAHPDASSYTVSYGISWSR